MSVRKIPCLRVFVYVSALAIATSAAAQPATKELLAYFAELHANRQPALKPESTTQVPKISPVTSPNVVTTPQDFIVAFDGIIAVMTVPSGETEPKHRAAVIRSTAEMPHNALLYVYGVDKTSLRDVTRQKPECDGNNGCAVSLKGLDVRVVGADEGLPLPSGNAGQCGHPLCVDKTFDVLVPHLGNDTHVLNGGDPHTDGVTEGTIAYGDVPQNPVVAYFEIANGGDLIACPFYDHLGHYRYTGATPCDAHECPYKQFNSISYWFGQTTAPATLEVRSAATDWNWAPVKLAPTTTTGLWVLVWNRPPLGTTPTPEHFVLNGQIVPKGHLSKIDLKDGDCDPNTMPCYDCPSIHAVVDVPGCSNTQWP